MKDLYNIAAAALLHDIGKLGQRANWPELSPQTLALEQHYCPTGEGARSTHRHVLWTSQWLELILPKLPQCMNLSLIRDAACCHHRPSTILDWTIAEADRLASGHDRRSTEEGENAGFRQVALESCLAKVRLADRPAVDSVSWLARELDECDSRILPGKPTSMDVSASWPRLAREVDQAVETMNLQNYSPAQAIMHLDAFTERFLSLVPSSAMDRPDVSLYDHSRATAALACAIHGFHASDVAPRESAVRNRDLSAFRFVAGSLRGIQDFIFDPSAPQKGLARSFRARSFFVSCLTESVVQRILNAIDYPATSCIMQAGGRFTLLLDAGANTFQKLQTALAELDRWFAVKAPAGLGFCDSADLCFSGQELSAERFSNLSGRLSTGLEEARLRPALHHMQTGSAWDEGTFISSRDMHEEAITQHAQFTALGRVLPAASAFTLNPSALPGMLDNSMDCAGYWLQLHAAQPQQGNVAGAMFWANLMPAAAVQPIRRAASYVPTLNRADIDPLRCYGDTGEDQDDPLTEGNLTTFEHLAAFSTTLDQNGKRSGVPMLACLKADVDRLGWLFAKGFGSDASIARVATMSRMLDLFFKGHLDWRFRQPDSPWRHVYTVFAGGDDLMLLGPWPVMMDLAGELRGWLDSLTGNNPSVTISAALSLFHSRMPPDRMARESDEALEAAKEAGRNRITVLNRVLTWSQFAQTRDIAAKLHTRMQPSSPVQLRGAFVYRLLRHAKSAEKVEMARKKGDQNIAIDDLTWRSHYSYDLRRNVIDPAERHGKGEPEFFRWLRELLPPPAASADPGRYAPAIIGATLALYRNRGTSS